MAAPYLRPHWLLRRIANPFMSQLGLATRLVVPGRRSGRMRQVPVNVLEHDGHRYLVSPRGETEWVRNLRASGWAELRRFRHRRRVRATEVAVEERPGIIAAYRDWWNMAVRRQFEALPRAEDHPVFRLQPAGEGEPQR